MKYDVNNANQKIIWGADDPALYSFPERKRIDDGVEPRVYTVFTYFKERYNVTLRYPKMPLIFLGNKEWFPIEFLSQSFGKMRAANNTEQKNAVLEYYKQNAGSNYIANIKDMVDKVSDRLSSMGMNLDMILKQYNLRRKSEPVQLMARVLPLPTLNFAEREAFLKNGDWAVMNRGEGIRFNK